MPLCFFVSDLHGRTRRYQRLFEAISAERPAAVFLGGDLLPHGLWRREAEAGEDFVQDFLLAGFRRLRASLEAVYPRVFLILGNDDGRAPEATFQAAQAEGLWQYVHERHAQLGDFDVYGYACVPPTPFLLKDWERYDVSRHVEPGCVSPEEGFRTVPVPENQVRYGTIQDDLARLVGDRSLDRAIMLFHAPPYQTGLDRAALDGRMVENVPMDVHVGSIAIQRFIAQRQPLVTLHGHIHESARMTGRWSERIGRSWCFSGAHDGPELALVRFDPEDPAQATRTLL